MKVAAVVVTYNRAAVLAQTLRALEQQSTPPDRVVVVDNRSTDGTAAMVGSDFPAARLVAMPDNVGFGAGLAAGMRAAMEEGADCCWLLDDDSTPAREALAGVLAAAEAHPGAGIVGYFGSRLRWGAPARLTRPEAPIGTVLGSLAVHRRDWTLVDGSLVPRRTIEAVGYPRADFFMMMEDVEYTSRIRRAGFDVLVLAPDLITRAHLGSAPGVIHRYPWREYYQTRNHLLMAMERRSARELAGWAYRQAKFVVHDLPSRRGREKIRFRLRGGLHGLRGVTGRSLDPATGRRQPR
jgi:rhamnopyranosyl-N-acetylglucosaminyl-diphospho-decaprenol beta-1,3/1,4-galactofuranosyltransferase